ncbi:MAG: hypothetical protein JNJ60_21015 [Rhodocyclaceae bacterium]|nr:hypothetical protein [Rhodocyclaceae bacterium]
MDQDTATGISATATRLPGKAWTAYLGVALLGLIALAAALALAWFQHAGAGLALAAAVLPVALYRILLLKSYALYYDDVGVWLYSGILPWKKGVAGVKWRDLDEAVFEPSFWSWLFRSYNLRIGHRYTKSSEIFLTQMADGQKSVMAINARHQALVRANVLS